MSELVTRCPHCSTAFHVNDQQLRAARGAVRCGSCLQVFHADKHLVFDKSDTVDKRLEALLENDDILIHDDMDLEDEDEVVEPPRDNDNAPAKTAKTLPYEPLISEAFGDSQWREIAAVSEVKEAPKEEDDDNALLVEEIEEWSSTPGAEESPTPKLLHKRTQSAQRETGNHGFESSGRKDFTGGVAKKGGSEREQLISAIEPAPLEVSWPLQSDRRVPGWLWALLALLLAAGILAQIAYFRFDSLSKRQPWREFYAALCPRLGCELPQQLDLQAIRTSNLVVRSHPEIQDALTVDAVLLNTAPFDQPFPNLLLTFSDLKNRPVARRLFTPRDYLQGELAGRQQMPAGSPVHIAIEIVDPGEAAVNYELHIAP